MNVLVTGGAGFIGTNFIFYILERYPDWNIVCLDKLTYAGNLNNLKPILNNPNFKFVKGDICCKKTVERLFEENNLDIVVNFAAESHVDKSIDNPSLFLRSNVKGVQVLLNACLKYGIKRFHQISTDEVYGDTELESKRKFKETDSLLPSSPYSASKAAADLLVLAYHRTYGLPVTISRSGNNYGQYQHSEKLIPKTIDYVLKEKIVPIYGTGKNVREWIHVLDHCRAIDYILCKGKEGEIYNVGTGEEKSNIEIVQFLFRLSKSYRPSMEYVQDRKGHDLRYALDSSKIKSELGWGKQIKFEDGLNETYTWYINRKD